MTISECPCSHHSRPHQEIENYKLGQHPIPITILSFPPLVLGIARQALYCFSAPSPPVSL
jgi:hypothetical protein